jgi:hypothetical protein
MSQIDQLNGVGRIHVVHWSKIEQNRTIGFKVSGKFNNSDKTKYEGAYIADKMQGHKISKLDDGRICDGELKTASFPIIDQVNGWKCKQFLLKTTNSFHVWVFMSFQTKMIYSLFVQDNGTRKIIDSNIPPNS